MRSFAVITVLLIFVGQLVAWLAGMPQPSLMPPFFILSLAIIVFGGAAAMIGYVLRLAYWEQEASPSRRVIATTRRFTSLDYLSRRVVPFVLVFIFLSVFSTFKVAIPLVNPFYLDGFLSDLDRWVFGTDPWRLTHAIIGPTGTWIIDFVYGLWFAAWFFAVLHFSLFAKAELQRRFFLSFLGVWTLLGIGMAILMSSAGPCFLVLIRHPYAERYADLFPLLNAPGAAYAQDYLAAAYVTGDIGLAKGISAMPSVHVAVAALLVIALRGYGRLVFGCALIFWMMILLGSVHLGWHYASDGVIGTIGAALLWRLTRRAPQPSKETAPRIGAPLARRT